MALWNHGLCHLPSFIVRHFLLKTLFRARLGKCTIHRGVKIFAPWKLVVGDGSNIQYRSFLDCRGGLEIGQDVDIALMVTIITQDHDVRDQNYLTRSRPVTISDGAVVGSKALLLPGCSMAKNSVLGAGAVLASSIPENMIYVGNPAKEIGERTAGMNYKCYYRRPFH